MANNTNERKRSSEYNHGRRDAETGAGPDYSQPTTEMLLDYIAGYQEEKRRQRDADVQAS
jgi:hypothetical protein